MVLYIPTEDGWERETGPQMTISPFKFYMKNNDIKNYISKCIKKSKLRIPKGFGGDGYIKALFNQRIIK